MTLTYRRINSGFVVLLTVPGPPGVCPLGPHATSRCGREADLVPRLVSSRCHSDVYVKSHQEGPGDSDLALGSQGPRDAGRGA